VANYNVFQVDGGGDTVPADQEPTTTEAAANANKKTPGSFTVQKSGFNVVQGGVYKMSFAYLYENPDNPSETIIGPSSPNFTFTLDTPDLTRAVTGLVVTPGLLSYGVKWDLIDKSLPENKWLIDIQIYESLTGAFAGEEYLVWNGNGNSATILVSDTNNRWIRVYTRDQDYHKKGVTFGPFKATDPIVVDVTGPGNVSSVTTSGGLDTIGVVGFNGYADISWPAVTGGGIRGYRIRFRPVTTPESSYSYADSPGTGTSYRLAGLGAGLVYEIAVATYDEYNNTSSSYVAGTNVTVGGTPYIASTVDVSGYFRAKANSTDADSTAFKFGYGIETGKRGLLFNASNYWHIDSSQSALFKVGGSTANYLLWNGTKLTIDGDINAKGGQFSGNIFMSTTGASIYSGTIDTATGNLTGNGFALNSTGLKVANGTNSVTLSAATGTITANAGSIANWNLSGTTLSKNNIILDSAGQIQVGSTAANSVYINSSNDYVMWAGNNTPDANAKFRVHKNGTLYAVGAVFGSGTSVAGYATSTELAATDTKATNAASTASTASTNASTALTNAQTAATNAATAKTAADAAKATADAALPKTSFDRASIVKAINNNVATTTIDGGIITTGTLSAAAVVTDFISAFQINADKINAGTIGTTVSITTPNITVGTEGSSYYFRTNQIRTGTTRGALGLNNVNMISASSAGMLSNWYPYNNDDVSLGLINPYEQRWKNIFLINNPNVSSDERLKKDVSVSTLGLDFIKKIRPVEYRMKARSRIGKKDEDGNAIYYPGTDKEVPELNEDDPGQRLHYGFIAQEVKSALDEIGVGDSAALWAIDNLEDPDSKQSLVYSEFISPLTRAVQELSDMVESLQQEVNTLKGI
jgi:hypothetical protein